MTTPLALGTNLALTGDLNAETWPEYLDRQTLSFAVIEAIGMCDFRVERLGFTMFGDQIVRFLIGESTWSRKLAIHRNDPVGIVYLLEDDGGSWLDERGNIKPIVAVQAITLGALVIGKYTGVKNILGSTTHRNNRLEYPTAPSASSIIVPVTPIES